MEFSRSNPATKTVIHQLLTLVRIWCKSKLTSVQLRNPCFCITMFSNLVQKIQRNSHKQQWPNDSSVAINHSHVSELWLPSDQDISDSLDFKKLPLNVIHGHGGVRHGHHVILWQRKRRTAFSHAECWKGTNKSIISDNVFTTGYCVY